MARPLRVQFSGGAYYLTLRANSRQALFRDDRDRGRFLVLLGRYSDQFSITLFAFLLTTRQVDLLLESPRANISKFMQCLGTSYVSYFNRRHKRRGALFEGRFKSHFIEKLKGLSEATRFIHLRGLQFGLKHRRFDPWCSYRAYLGKKTPDLLDTCPVLSQFGNESRAQRRAYQEFVEKKGIAKELSVSRCGSTLIPPPSQSVGRRAERSEEIARRIMDEVRIFLSPEEVGSPNERNQGALVRHLTMYLVRRHTDLSLNAIGAMLGVKPSTVAQGISKIQQKLQRGEVSGRVKELIDNVPRVAGDSHAVSYRSAVD